MYKTEHISNSVIQTIEIGRKLGALLAPGDVVCLDGDLGAGKTHFVKGIASHFGIDENLVNSPTFVIIQEYSGSLPVYHFDAYRIKNEQEAMDLGIEEYFGGEGVCVVEWSQHFGNLIPQDAIKVQINATGNTERLIKIDR